MLLPIQIGLWWRHDLWIINLKGMEGRNHGPVSGNNPELPWTDTEKY